MITFIMRIHVKIYDGWNNSLKRQKRKPINPIRLVARKIVAFETIGLTRKKRKALENNICELIRNGKYDFSIK